MQRKVKASTLVDRHYSTHAAPGTGTGMAPEYWLVNLEEQTIEIFVLEEGTYRSLGVFQGKQTLPSRVVPEIVVPVAQFFDWAGGLL